MLGYRLVFIISYVGQCWAVINWANMGHSVMTSLMANEQVRSLPDEIKELMQRFASPNNLSQPPPPTPVQPQQDPLPSTTIWPSIINDKIPNNNNQLTPTPTTVPPNPPANQNPTPPPSPSPTQVTQPLPNPDSNNNQNQQNQNPKGSDNTVETATLYFTDYVYSSASYYSQSQTQSSSSSKPSTIGTRMDFGMVPSSATNYSPTHPLISVITMSIGLIFICC